MRISAITAAIANPTMKTIPIMNNAPAAMMVMEGRYSTVTLFARFRGWSTSQPRRVATW
jgi:hypothetical protein